MIRLQSVAVLILTALLSTNARADSPDTPGGKPLWEKSGDVLQWGIPLVGLGLSFLLDGEGGWSFGGSNLSSTFSSFSMGELDGFGWPGPQLTGSRRRNFLISFARMEVATYALKYAINAERPNGGGQSFPSGHTAAAFMGAEFIRKEYGLWWGIPAYAAATWVGYTREESHNHYWRDVAGGAVLGILANHDFGGGLTHGQFAGGSWAVEPTMMAPTQNNWIRSSSETLRPELGIGEMAPGIKLTWRF